MNQEYELLVPFPGHSVGDIITVNEKGKWKLGNILLDPLKNPHCFKAVEREKSW